MGERPLGITASRPRNDPGLYDDLVDSWWEARGTFAMLHWLAAARAALIPPAGAEQALLVDIGCGGGLLAPFALAKGYRHVGIDLSGPGLLLAASHGITPVRADARSVPLRTGCADVVVAGEVLEHVAPFTAVTDEACRLVRPGGLLVLDTIADTFLARLVVVHLAEHIHGGAPPGIHDPKLFVDRQRLVRRAKEHGVDLELNGLRPSARELFDYLRNKRNDVTMVLSRSTAVLFQGAGRKSL